MIELSPEFADERNAALAIAVARLAEENGLDKENTCLIRFYRNEKQIVGLDVSGPKDLTEIILNAMDYWKKIETARLSAVQSLKHDVGAIVRGADNSEN